MPDLPALPADLYAALKADIEARGVLVPVLVDAASGEVLDGRVRMQICKELGIKDVPTLYLSQLSEVDRADLRRSCNALRRHLTRAQLRTLLEWEVRCHPEESDGSIAGRVGCSDKTVGAARRRAGPEVPDLKFRMGRDGKRYRAPQARPAVFATTRSQGTMARRLLGEMGDAAPRITMSAGRLHREKHRADRREGLGTRAVALPAEYTVQCCDFRKARIEPGSCDLALGDPPWGDDWRRHRADYSQAVFSALKPGAWFACYTGQNNMVDWVRVLETAGFRYKWVVAAINSRGRGHLRQNGCIRTRWRPIVLLVKPGVTRNCVLMDVIRTEPEKDCHEWQQAVGESEHLIRGLTREGDLICDLTIGSGTSGVACAVVGGRRYYGCEIRADLVRVARSRIDDALREGEKGVGWA